MVVLREETDITKVNSKLAILEQQQEVINCEAKLRQLLETMANFLLNLKKTYAGKYKLPVTYFCLAFSNFSNNIYLQLSTTQSVSSRFLSVIFLHFALIVL